MVLDRQQLVAAFGGAEARLASTQLVERSLVVGPVAASAYVGVDANGYWALVIRTRRSQRPVPTLRLSSIFVEYGAEYKLHADGAVEALRVCVIKCTSLESAVQLLFARYCLAMIQELPLDPTDSDIESEVSKWVSLFWKLQSPPRTTVIGLIGELVLLDAVDDVSAWVRAWHREPTDNLDFAFSKPSMSVEVKATSSQRRVHELSIHQAKPVVDDRHYFASVIVELRESGARLGDLVEDISRRLAGPTDADIFWRSLVGVCGVSLAEYLEVRFMRDAARASVLLYEASLVPQPHVSLPIPAGVSGIRFRSDFSSVEPANPAPVLSFVPRP